MAEKVALDIKLKETEKKQEKIALKIDGELFEIILNADKKSLIKARLYLSKMAQGKKSDEELSKEITNDFDMMYHFISLIIENTDETMELLVELVMSGLENEAEQVANLIVKKLETAMN